MARIHQTLDTKEVRHRAAEIRRHWSPLEKIRRTGLPPDIPAKLRQIILGPSEPDWSTASGFGAGNGHHAAY